MGEECEEENAKTGLLGGCLLPKIVQMEDAEGQFSTRSCFLLRWKGWRFSTSSFLREAIFQDEDGSREAATKPDLGGAVRGYLEAFLVCILS